MYFPSFGRSSVHDHCGRTLTCSGLWCPPKVSSDPESAGLSLSAGYPGLRSCNWPPPASVAVEPLPPSDAGALYPRCTAAWTPPEEHTRGTRLSRCNWTNGGVHFFYQAGRIEPPTGSVFGPQLKKNLHFVESYMRPKSLCKRPFSTSLHSPNQPLGGSVLLQPMLKTMLNVWGFVWCYCVDVCSQSSVCPLLPSAAPSELGWFL